MRQVLFCWTFRKGQKGMRERKWSSLLPYQAFIFPCSKELLKQNQSRLGFWSFFGISCCFLSSPRSLGMIPPCPILTCLRGFWGFYFVCFLFVLPILCSRLLNQVVGLGFGGAWGWSSHRLEPHCRLHISAPHEARVLASSHFPSDLPHLTTDQMEKVLPPALSA